jgi:hypothetical protein
MRSRLVPFTSLLLLAACGHPATPDERLVVAPFPAKATDSQLLQWAEDLLTGRCMSVHGFRYTVPLPAATSQRKPNPYGNDDVTWARRHGYGLTEPPPAPRRGPNALYVTSLPPDRRTAYKLALIGNGRHTVAARPPGGPVITTSSDGCVADARRRLYGDLGTWFRLSVTVTNLDADIQPHVVRAAPYVKALARWLACMRDRKLIASSPGAASQQAARAFAAPGVDRRQAHLREISIAVADASCARTSQLVSVANRLDAAYRARANAEHRAEITAYGLVLTDARARARALERRWAHGAPTGKGEDR